MRGYSSNSIYGDGEIDSVAIYGTENWTVDQEDGTVNEVPGPREFRHTMRTFINGLIASGFEILGISTSTGRTKKTRSRVRGNISRRSARRIWRSGRKEVMIVELEPRPRLDRNAKVSVERQPERICRVLHLL